MQFLFIVEAGFKMGMGHLMRCRALLLELQSRGYIADLWLHGDESAMEGRIWPEQMKLFFSAQEQSISSVCDDINDLLKHSQYDWLVVDGYNFLELPLYEQFEIHGVKLLKFDDLAVRSFRTDILLNQNSINKEIYQDGHVKASNFLLGPQYALIDKEYKNNNEIPRLFGSLRSLLITFGGVDRHGRTERVLKLLETYKESLDITVVVGAYYPYINKLKSWKCHHSIRIVQNVPNLSRLMKQSDLTITAGGTTVWQGCCVGAPMLVLQLVDNQHFATDTIREHKAGLCLDVSLNPKLNAGIVEYDFLELFLQAAEPKARAKLSSNARQLVDGNGAANVADALVSLRYS